MKRSANEAAVRLKPRNGDLSKQIQNIMTDLTYRGKQYVKNKEILQKEAVLINYRGLEMMSKRIHEAMKAEMG